MAYPLIGKETIEIDWKNFTRGMSTSDYTSDAGFSAGVDIPNNAASYVNPLVNPGALSFPATPTDKSTNLTGQMIASCEDPTLGGGGATRLFVSADASNIGRFYSINSVGDLTQVGSADGTAGAVYIAGKTDMIGFAAETYVTNQHYIVRWESPSTFVLTFYDFNSTYSNNASVPHPALVYRNFAYYGNGNILLRQSGAGVAPVTILTLPANQVIVALGIDPGSGNMLISVVSQINISGTVNSQAFVLYYDGSSPESTKIVPVDTMITAFYNVGATVFITYGQKLGYWTGAGIQFLRTLLIQLDNTQLAYKHHLTNIDETLYIVERQNILAYGQVMQGVAKAFWYLYGNSPGGTPTNLSLVTNIGNNTLAYSYATSKFATLDTSSIGESGQLYTQNYNFARTINFAQVIIQFTTLIPINTDIGSASIMDENNTVTPIGLVRTEQSNVSWVTLPWPSLTVRQLQLQYIPILPYPIFRITIFYNNI